MAEAYGLWDSQSPRLWDRQLGRAQPILSWVELSSVGPHTGSPDTSTRHCHVLMGGTCSQRTQPRRVEMARPKPHRETHLWTGLQLPANVICRPCGSATGGLWLLLGPGSADGRGSCLHPGEDSPGPATMASVPLVPSVGGRALLPPHLAAQEPVHLPTCPPAHMPTFRPCSPLCQRTR